MIAVSAVAIYAALTISISEWRTAHRRRMNDLDSKANTRAIDSLLNYETVKYFGNENFEAERYDRNLASYERAVVTSETSLGLLNATQAAVIAIAVSLLMWRAADGIVNGPLTLGDLVMVNALLIQLYIPLNFLGVMYREIKQAVVDMEKMFRLLGENREVRDAPGAPPLVVTGAGVRFEHVDFTYDGIRPILRDVSFTIPAGHKVAVVGSSGSGKSTLARLLFRFYDVNAGPHHHRRPGHPRSPAVKPACGARASYRRTRCSSTTRFSTTSRTVVPAPPVKRSRMRRAWPHLGVHRAASGEMGDKRGRARLETFGRREATCVHRANGAEESADPHLRRSHVCARFAHGEVHSGASWRRSRATARRW